MQRHLATFAPLRYSLAVASVGVTVAAALWVRSVALAGGQLLLLAVLVSGWAAGLRPALVAWILACVAFEYYFTQPFDSFKLNVAEIPRLAIFVVVSGLLAVVSAARRRAEDSLAEARDELDARVRARTAELRALVEAVDGIVWEADAATLRFAFVSGQAERILGYPVHRWLAEPTFWRDHIHPDDRESVLGVVERAAIDEAPCDVDYRMLSVNGDVVWLRDRLTVVADPGRPARLRGMMVDVTERKRAEEERQARRWLVESMDRVHRAIQSTSDLEEMMSAVLDVTIAVFACDRAWLVSPCDPDAPAYSVKMHRSRPEFPLPVAVGDEIPIDPVTTEVMRTVTSAPGPVQFAPGAVHGVTDIVAARWGVQSRLLMALHPKGARPYLFGLSQCSHARVWTAQEEALFQAIGRRLADALTSLSIFHSLRESEARYRSIFDSTGVSIWEQDFSRAKAALDELRAEGVRNFRAYFAAHGDVVRRLDSLVRVVDVNETTVRMFGARSKAELLASLPRLRTPESRANFVETLADIAEGRTARESELVLQTLDGRRVNVLSTILFPPAATGFGRLLITMIEVTQRRVAEYLAGAVFEFSPDAMYIVGRDYRYRRVNPAFERRWKLPAEKIVGMRMDELAGRQSFEETYKPHMDRCFAGEEVSFAGWFPTPDGLQYLSATYTPLRPNSRDVDAMLAITRNLTDHARASEALQQAHTDLAHVTRVTTLGEMTASIAHEVNQPLGAIVADANASLNWLAAPTPNLERVREALEAIVTDGHRAGDVIQRIRQLATRSVPQKVALEVNDVIREVLPLISNEVRGHAVDLRLELAQDLPKVAADRVQLQQVLINLALNGMEAMTGTAGGRPRDLVIRSQRRDDEVVVALQDTGVGIDPHRVDQMFSAFYSTKPGGMGMGLSISRSIIEEHGGRLWGAANRVHGATFSFALPVLP
ncbi:MAG TPA: PAS domain-containing protein [Methylomirabilota bacterium]|nr:PAS domain-containing protein [Methylomirabilota bacterium]